MSSFRIIPTLLLKKGGLVKGQSFANHKYVGDPINAVRIFNAKEVDELFFFDIESTLNGEHIDLDVVSKLANECYMPFAVGGGINSIDLISRLIELGVEKVVINSYAISEPDFIKEAAETFGSQAIVVCIDYKSDKNGLKKVFLNSSTKETDYDALKFAKLCSEMGAGELVLNSIEKDGMQNGFDIDFIKKVSDLVSVPVIGGCGAGNLSHFKSLKLSTNASAGTGGSFFVFHGPLNAVLISYPKKSEINNL